MSRYAVRNVAFFISFFVIGCSGCHSKPETPPATRKPDQPAGAVLLDPATAPNPLPLPAPKPMSEAVKKKYFLFPEDKPIIPYTKPGPFASHVFVDPGSGKLAWRAMVCTAPDCPSRKSGKPPERFAMRYANLYPLPNGEIPNLIADGAGPQACPFCGRSQTITEYLAPEDESRKKRLLDEMQQAYTLRAAARAKGSTKAENVRTPQEIMDEINAIPRHYLLDKDMDYAPLEAAAQQPTELPGP